MNKDGIEMVRMTFKEATALLAEKTGVPYVLHPEKGDGKVATPLYKAAERGLLEIVVGIGGEQQYVDSRSFAAYLDRFESRLDARRRVVLEPCPLGDNKEKENDDE